MAPKARILAIDDQPWFRQLLVGLLAEAGYEAVASPTGKSALERIEAQEVFDLVILDPAGPGAGGLETLGAIRESGEGVPVLVVTGSGDPGAIVAAMKRGAADYLLKPIDRSVLLQTIASLLEARRPAAAQAPMEPVEPTAGLRALEALEAAPRQALAEGLLALAVEAAPTPAPGGRSGPEPMPAEPRAVAPAFEADRGIERVAPPLRDPETGLLSRAFLEEVIRSEIPKASRYGRGLSIQCVDVGAGEGARDLASAELVASLRSTDVLTHEAAGRFWLLASEADRLGAVVMKRRLADRLREALTALDAPVEMALGAASYPIDGESFERLAEVALERARAEAHSSARKLGVEPGLSLAEMGGRLLAHAASRPEGFVAEAAELLIGELRCRPGDRGLLFLAPGVERSAFLGPLSALGATETATDVFLATDGDTLPSGTAVQALPLPPNVSADTTWIVRFGEAPPYVLVAGAPRAGGLRPVFDSDDPTLVEQLAFRLRAEVGFGVRA